MIPSLQSSILLCVKPGITWFSWTTTQAFAQRYAHSGAGALGGRRPLECARLGMLRCDMMILTVAFIY